MTASPHYDTDFYGWAFQTAHLIRQKKFDQLDINHIAEEIEDMGKNIQRELRSRLMVLLCHLLKWKFESSKRSKNWKTTIKSQRLEIALVLKENPSLKSKLIASLEEAYPSAVVYNAP